MTALSRITNADDVNRCGSHVFTRTGSPFSLCRFWSVNLSQCGQHCSWPWRLHRQISRSLTMSADHFASVCSAANFQRLVTRSLTSTPQSR